MTGTTYGKIIKEDMRSRKGLRQVKYVKYLFIKFTFILTRPRTNVKKLYYEKKWVNQAKKSAAGKKFFPICIVIFNFSLKF